VELVGAHLVRRKSGTQPGSVYTPVPADRQREAVAFLDTVAFRVPSWLVAPEITGRFEPIGTATRVMALQARILQKLLASRRLTTLAEMEILASDLDDPYPLAQMLSDVRRSLWSELTGRRVRIDPYRQSLQQTHLVLVRSLLAVPPMLPRTTASAQNRW